MSSPSDGAVESHEAPVAIGATVTPPRTSGLPSAAVVLWTWARRALAGDLSAERGTPRAQASVSAAELAYLLDIMLLAVVARVVIAINLPSVYHPDETFQYWEAGYRLVFGYGIVPWEYREGIRSLLLPGAIAGIIWFVRSLGGGLEAWHFAVQLALSLASLSVVATAYFWARRVSGVAAAVLAAFVAASWFEFVYFSAKPFTEVVAGSVLFPAAYLLCVRPGAGWRLLVAGGALLGLTIGLRFQLAPAVLIILLSSALRWRGRVVFAAAGLAVALLACGILDWVTLGSPFQSIWKYFVANVVADKASDFGTKPIFWYPFYYANAWPGFVVPMLCFWAMGVRRAPLLLLAPLAIVLAHSLIGHKEYRFVYPTLPFLLTLASIGAAELYAMIADALFPRWKRLGFLFVCAGWLLTSISLAAQDGFRPNFVKEADTIKAFQAAAQSPDLCGLAEAGVSWAFAPGYATLGRNVPIYPLEDEAAGEALEPAYNFVLHRGVDWPFISRDYHDVGCFDDACLAMRPGLCTPVKEKQINAVLQQSGQ